MEKKKNRSVVYCRLAFVDVRWTEWNEKDFSKRADDDRNSKQIERKAIDSSLLLRTANMENVFRQ